jgi:hypothetical protein
MIAVIHKLLQQLAMWVIWNVPIGAAAPHVFAFALGSKEVLKKDSSS